jgi:AraC-like DNA-binding protein
VIWEKGYSTIEPQIDADGVHLWPFDKVFPIDVRFFVFGGRGDIRMNRHGYFEVFHVLHGQMRFQIQHRYFTARPGDLLVIGSTFFHRPVKSESTVTKAAALYFQREVIRANDSSAEDIEYLMPFLAQDSQFPHLVPAKTGIPDQVFDFIKRIHAELPSTSARSRLTVKTYLKTILILLVNHYAELHLSLDTFHRKQEDIERLQPLFEIIRRCFPQAITVKDAAASVHMSKSHFTRFFRNVTGQAFVTYLHHLRIARAQALLASTNRSIAEIGQEAGFCDQSYFGLIFHRLVGMPPRQYRNQFRNSARDSADYGELYDNQPQGVVQLASTLSGLPGTEKQRLVQ